MILDTTIVTLTLHSNVLNLNSHICFLTFFSKYFKQDGHLQLDVGAFVTALEVYKLFNFLCT